VGEVSEKADKTKEIKKRVCKLGHHSTGEQVKKHETKEFVCYYSDFVLFY